MRHRVESAEVEYLDQDGEVQRGVLDQEPWSDDELRLLDVDMDRVQDIRDILRSNLSDMAAHRAIYQLYLENSQADNEQTRFHAMDMLARLRFLSGIVPKDALEKEPLFFNSDGCVSSFQDSSE